MGYRKLEARDKHNGFKRKKMRLSIKLTSPSIRLQGMTMHKNLHALKPLLKRGNTRLEGWLGNLPLAMAK